MKQHSWKITIVVAMIATLSGTAVAEGDFLMHGRISFDTGTAMVKNASEENWSAAVVNTLVMPGDTVWVDQSGTAELEMAAGSFLRLADGSKAEVVSLPPNGYIRGWMGSFYIHRLSRSQGDFIFTMPSATVEIPPDAMVRVDIDATGAATVSVRWGSAKIRTDQGGDVTAAESTRVWVDPGLLPSEPTPFDRAQTDAFDDWNNERTRLLVEGVKTVPKNVTIRESTVGGYDLDRYGEWVYVDNRPYWRPTVVVNYVPYRYGNWNYVPAVGHVWVDEYPFAYVTTHYGRWRHTPAYGWVWSYDPVWSPAWVASVRVGDYYAWSPVDYYNRPVIVAGGSTFAVGGVSFCSFSTSYVRHTYLYAGPTYVYAPSTVVINTFNAAPPRHINVWNISHNQRSRPSVPFDSRYIAGERDYNPRRSIRGGQGDWIKDFAPSDRARRLEANLGRTQFAAAAPRSGAGRSLRTATTANGHVAQTRQVRLGQTEQTYVSRAARTTDAPNTSRTQFVPESSRLANMTARSGGSIRSGAAAPDSVRNVVVPSRSGTTATAHSSGQLNQRSISTPSARRNGSSSNESNRVALRDMESSVPSPRTSLTPQRTTIRSNSGTTSPRTSQPTTTSPRSTLTPSPTVRNGSTTIQRSAPAPNTSSSVRRTTPSASPTVRSGSTTIQRSAPAPSTSSSVRRTTPSASPTVRRERTTIQRSAPSTSTRSLSVPSTRSQGSSSSIPSTRSLSVPSTRSQGNSISTPSTRSGSISPSSRFSMPSSRSSSSSVRRPSSSSGLSSRSRR